MKLGVITPTALECLGFRLVEDNLWAWGSYTTPKGEYKPILTFNSFLTTSNITCDLDWHEQYTFDRIVTTTTEIEEIQNKVSAYLAAWNGK